MQTLLISWTGNKNPKNPKNRFLPLEFCSLYRAISNTMKLLSICALSALLSLAAAAPDLSSYPFSATLLEDSYELFWRFDRDLKNITFAVRVKTTGWVGFGLSPNGEMTNSDLVLGWVDADDNKRGYLNVSFFFFCSG